MAIKVHGNLFSTATMRVLVCLEEKALPYQFVPVDMGSGEHKNQSFLALNPFGQVPAFEDGDLKLFDSRAINRYISEAYAEQGTPLLVSLQHDPKGMAPVHVWMEVEAQKYDGPASKLYFELIVKPILGMATDDGVVEEQRAALAKVLDVYEGRLAQSKYLGGDAVTLADLHHLPTLNSLVGTPVKAVFDSRPHVSAWCADILARPAWKKVLELKKSK